MGRKWHWVLWIYVAGFLLMQAHNLYAAYASGGFQREHGTRDLLVLAAIYLGFGALWPVVLVVTILQGLGLFRGPITL